MINRFRRFPGAVIALGACSTTVWRGRRGGREMNVRSLRVLVVSAAMVTGFVTLSGISAVSAAGPLGTSVDHYPRTTGLNTTRNPEQFWIQGNQVMHMFGSNGAWSVPSTLSGPPAGISSVEVGYDRNYLDNPELYVVSTDGSVWHDFVTPGRGSGWSGWGTLGRPAPGVYGQVVVSRNYLDNQEVYVLGKDQQVWHSFSTPGLGSGWSAWSPLGTPAPGIAPGSDVHVSRNNVNNQELYVSAGDGQVWHSFSTPGIGSGWSAWSPLGSAAGATGDVGVWRNWSSNQEMFRVAGNTVWHDYATPGVGSGWSGWYPLAALPPGVSLTGWIGLADDKDIGQLTLWVGDTTGHNWNTMLTESNAWTPWTTTPPALPPPPIPAPSPVVSTHGVIHAPFIGDWQVIEGSLAGGVVNTSQFSAGVIHMPGTATLCSSGNSVLGAHRTTAPAPFRQLDRLTTGMVILASQNGVDCSYQVVESHIDYVGTAAAATDAANDVLDQSSRFGSDHRLTLFACSKPDRTPTSTMYRLIVQLVQL